MIDNLFTKHNEINQNKTEMKLNHFGSIRLLKKIGCFLSDTMYRQMGRSVLQQYGKLLPLGEQKRLLGSLLILHTLLE